MANQQGIEIAFSQVGLTYGSDANAVCALRDVSFSVAPGESVAIIGPSGCGKSSMLHMAAGLIVPTEGQVLVDRAPLPAPRKGTAFIPQDLGLFPWKSVVDNAALGLTLRGVGKAAARLDALAALEKVGLQEFARAYPKQLSGGMRQRLALARALAIHADAVLMDEPLSAIDALQRESLQQTLLDLWQLRHHTQLLVTHSIEEAVFLGQRIIVFSERPGTVVRDIDNPGMGTADYRDSAAFSATCKTVRDALAARDATDRPNTASASETHNTAPATGSEEDSR